MAFHQETRNAIHVYANHFKYHPESYMRQWYRWVFENVWAAVIGIQWFNSLPIDRTNKNSLLRYIDGIDDDEIVADLLVVMMVECKSFKLNVER